MVLKKSQSNHTVKSRWSQKTA